jgi:hypothetical protein
MRPWYHLRGWNNRTTAPRVHSRGRPFLGLPSLCNDERRYSFVSDKQDDQIHITIRAGANKFTYEGGKLFLAGVLIALAIIGAALVNAGLISS